jgi:hypothetical protein
MSGEPNIETNSVLGRIWGYFVAQMHSDSAELAIGGGKADEDEGKEEKQIEETQETEETEVDLENEKVKTAISSEVEKVVKSRVAREKSKTEAAEARATAAEKKLVDAEAKLTTLTGDMAKVESDRDSALKNVMVYKLSIEEKVSPDLVNSLKGDDEDSLRKAIQKFAKGAGGAGSVDRIFDGKQIGLKSGNGKTLKEIALEAAARNNR